MKDSLEDNPTYPHFTDTVHINFRTLWNVQKMWWVFHTHFLFWFFDAVSILVFSKLLNYLSPQYTYSNSILDVKFLHWILISIGNFHSYSVHTLIDMLMSGFLTFRSFWYSSLLLNIIYHNQFSHSASTFSQIYLNNFFISPETYVNVYYVQKCCQTFLACMPTLWNKIWFYFYFINIKYMLNTFLG